MRIATVAEKHSPIDTNTAPFCRLVDATRHPHFYLWVTISHRLANYYHSQGVPEKKLIVLSDAVDLKLFQRPDRLPASPYAENCPNVAYVGHLYDYKGIPTVLEAAAIALDVLLLPPSQHHPSAAWTSPVKLGEYLASGTPIVATDIPALRDWLTDKEVEFVEPDNAEAMVEGIRHLLSDRQRAEQLRRYGLVKAQELSYEQRAEAILNSCGLCDRSS